MTGNGQTADYVSPEKYMSYKRAAEQLVEATLQNILDQGLNIELMVLVLWRVMSAMLAPHVTLSSLERDLQALYDVRTARQSLH